MDAEFATHTADADAAIAPPAAQPCAHCGERLGANSVAFSAPENRALDVLAATPKIWVCCVGCRAAMAFSLSLEIANAAPTAEDFSAWDQAHLLAECPRDTQGRYLLCLAIETIHCPNCAWLIEASVQRVAPDVELSVDVPLRLVHLQFDPQRQPLSHIIAALAANGYAARAVSDSRDLSAQRQSLKQLFVAGFCAVQAMMFAEPLYWSGSDLPPQTAQFFAWLSALITVPVVSYSATRFFRGALTELRLRRPGMDTLISLSITLALLGSCIGLLLGNTAVYFDAIAMFVFALLLGRTLESMLMARARAAAMRLRGTVPSLATLENGASCAVHDLKIGDCLRAAVGEILVADGILQSAQCSLSAAMLDGEFAPKPRIQGDQVYAGSSVRSGECVYRVQALGADTQIAQIARLSNRAAAYRAPNAAQQAQMATRFTLFVLLFALATAAFWCWLAPERALSITLSVLTVACPCALGLALPLTRAVAHARLQRMGVILLKPDVLERLNRVDCVLLDKTGTLTALEIEHMRVSTSGALSVAEALVIAEKLERGQSHPWGQALCSAYSQQAQSTAPLAAPASEIDLHPGLGICGMVAQQRWRLGAPHWFGLADADGVVLDGPSGRAVFTLSERLQPGAELCVAGLRAQGLGVAILSGDSRARVENAAARLGITELSYRQSPEQKRAAVQALSSAGRYPMMLGDGVNDAIALASAHVAVSLGAASALAHAHADVLMLAAPSHGNRSDGTDLQRLPQVLAIARRASRIARQNVYWAQGYNLAAIPLAAMGFIGPGWAALGMGLSSLLVTLNAARLWRDDSVTRSDMGAPAELVERAA